MQSSSPAERDPSPSNDRAALRRAGLRAATARRPNAVFVVIEMTVLVLVCALAMVTVIVSTGEGERHEPTVTVQGGSVQSDAEAAFGGTASATRRPRVTGTSR